MLRIPLLLCLMLPQAPVKETLQEPTAAKDASYLPPKLIKQTKPSYPDEAFRRGIQGIVLLQFVIDIDGRVQHPTVLESVPGLDEAALKCIKKWRFSPAQEFGKPIPTVAKSPMSFCIEEKGCNGARVESKKE